MQIAFMLCKPNLLKWQAKKQENTRNSSILLYFRKRSSYSCNIRIVVRGQIQFQFSLKQLKMYILFQQKETASELTLPQYIISA
jgi:hypothetical protein